MTVRGIMVGEARDLTFRQDLAAIKFVGDSWLQTRYRNL